MTSYTKDIRSFLTDCGGSVSEEEFTESAMYWLSRDSKRLAAKTTGRHLTSLKKFAEAMKIQHDLNQYRAPQPMKADPHPLPEGIEGVYRMIEAAESVEMEGLIALCGLCGLRISEALSVRSTMIDPHERVLRVRGKGNKDRKVPISSKAWEFIEALYIRSYLRDNRLFFKWQERQARKLITETAAAAGLMRRVASHDLRATFATHIYGRTRNLRVVQNLLGHSSISTTEVYLGVTDGQMKDAVEEL